MKKFLGIIASTALIVNGIAFASHPTRIPPTRIPPPRPVPVIRPYVEARQAHQQARIFKGVNNGQLTKGEFKALEKGEQKINKIEHKAFADGVVTPKEGMKLEKSLDKESRMIYRFKHNGITPGGGTVPPPFAQKWSNTRQKNQQVRIWKGVKNGQLTKGEFKKLEKGAIKTEKVENKILSDGVVTQKEAYKLDKTLDKESQLIYKLKHNDKKPPVATPPASESDSSDNNGSNE